MSLKRQYDLRSITADGRGIDRRAVRGRNGNAQGGVDVRRGHDVRLRSRSADVDARCAGRVAAPPLIREGERRRPGPRSVARRQRLPEPSHTCDRGWLEVHRGSCRRSDDGGLGRVGGRRAGGIGARYSDAKCRADVGCHGRVGLGYRASDVCTRGIASLPLVRGYRPGATPAAGGRGERQTLNRVSRDRRGRRCSPAATTVPTNRIRLFCSSAISTSPAGVTATAFGTLTCAAAAGPPSPV